MKVTRIQAHNVKGRSFQLPLHPVSLIHGGNFSGKSAVAVALRLGLSGFLPPPIGKTASAIYAACAGNPDESGEMSIAIDFEGGRPSSIRFTKTGGRVSVQSTGNSMLPPILVDPKTFFALTGPARMLAVFEACNVTVDKDSIRSLLFPICPTALPDFARKAAIGEVTEGVVARLAAATSPHIALKSSVDWIRELERAAKNNVATQEGIVAGLIWDDDEPVDVSLKVADAARAVTDAEVHLRGLRKQVEDFARVEQSRAFLQERILQIRTEIPTYEWDAPPAQPDPSIIKNAQEEVRKALARNAELDHQRRHYGEQMERLKNGRCPTCGASCADAYSHALSAAADIPDPVKVAPLEAAVASAMKAANDARQRLSEYNRDMTTMQNLKTELATHEKSLATMVLGEKPDAAAIAFAQNAADRARSVHAILNEAQAKWEAYNQMKSRREAAQHALAASRCKLLVFEACVKAIRAKIESIVEESFGFVLDLTGAFTDGILNSPLEFNDGEIGRRVSIADIKQGCTAQIGSWISHESFSGTEEAIAYAAFSVAMAMQAPFRLVILDEMGRMDADRKETVLYRMNQLVAEGKIDQFIGIDTVPSNLSGIVTDIPITTDSPI